MCPFDRTVGPVIVTPPLAACADSPEPQRFTRLCPMQREVVECDGAMQIRLCSEMFLPRFQNKCCYWSLRLGRILLLLCAFAVGSQSAPRFAIRLVASEEEICV